MPKDLYSIHGIGGGLVVAAGAEGRLTMFTGDVYTAREVEPPTQYDLRGVWVESPWRAWAIGDAGTVLRWDGALWVPVALASRVDGLTCIWGHPDDGLWIGGRRYLFNVHPTHGSTLIATDLALRAIWGRHGADIWYLCEGRTLLHWRDDERAERHELPGDEDEEWTAVAGTPEGDTYVVGLSGFMMRTNGRRWEEIPTDTTELITGAVCAAGSLYVTTDGGLVREWRNHRWRTVAFSAFGPLYSVCYSDGVLWAAGARGVVIQHRPDSDEGRKP